MQSLLKLAKQSLLERTIQVYSDRRDEIEWADYRSHFSEMGWIIAKIDQIESFLELVKQLEEGEFAQLGLFPSDEDMIEEFMRDLLR